MSAQDESIKGAMPTLVATWEYLQEKGYTRPFDPYRCAFDSLESFDIPYEGSLVGAMVRVKAGSIRIGLVPITIEEDDTILQVVAHCHDRVIVYYPESEIVVGWIDPEEYEVVKIESRLTPKSLQ